MSSILSLAVRKNAFSRSIKTSKHSRYVPDKKELRLNILCIKDNNIPALANPCTPGRFQYYGLNCSFVSSRKCVQGLYRDGTSTFSVRTKNADHSIAPTALLVLSARAAGAGRISTNLRSAKRGVVLVGGRPGRERRSDCPRFG